MLKHSYRVGVLTASDSSFAGTRPDASGPAICELMEKAGYTVAQKALLPDEAAQISAQLRGWSESGEIDLILTTGGTGLAPRDCMPEATLAVATRLVPGIAEAIRAYSLPITGRAMLSRAVAVICGRVLIINLPGSPKAVHEALGFVLPQLPHALDILNQNDGECARP
ncbi:MogA/MoaB family molybdenum cofactor biosynthesis protein [Ruminococcaceae bacterium OttesenSCG-928-A16]|nr:MogA/MoaB family molybdenum cofactor biosynthesis protein [Ruminococcaceae bacterium OttesenSCG-928-A16]